MNLKRLMAVGLAGMFAVAAGSETAQAHIRKGAGLERYEQFFMGMKKADGSRSCCGGNDAWVDMEEIRTVDADGTTHYAMKLYEDTDQNAIPEGVVVPVLDENIISREFSTAVCSAFNATKSEQQKSCVVYPDNAAWMTNWNKDTSPNGPSTVWCYLPKRLAVGG